MKFRFALLLLLAGCAGKSTPPGEFLVAATLWQRVAGENRALSYQAFRLAREVFDRDDRRRDKTRGKHAVVVDVDETVLDNGPYQAEQILAGTAYPAGWSQWIDRASAEALPGAVEFLTHVHGKGARIFYITNRTESEKAATIANLKKAGFPDVSEETFLGRSTESSKETRRRRVQKDYRIVMLLGDNLNDFSDAFDGKNVEERVAAVDKFKREFGSRFIVLPNPVYGDWEGAVYNYRWDLPSGDKARLRREALRNSLPR